MDTKVTAAAIPSRAQREREFLRLFYLLTPEDRALTKRLMDAYVAMDLGQATPEQLSLIEQVRLEIAQANAKKVLA